MDERENWLRAVEFRHPAWIPCKVTLSPQTWKIYRQDLERIVLAHPRVFPRYELGDVDFDDLPDTYREGEYYRDNWGCLWYNIEDGLEGQVVEHPLEDWGALATYQPPDPSRLAERGDRDWSQIEHDIADQKRDGLLTWGQGERLFDRLYFLRGFENLMLDFAEEPPELRQLIGVLGEHERRLVGRWLEIGVDVMGFHTDIGTQMGLMISPRSFRKYVKPLFACVFEMCRQAGTHVFLSSDGRLLDIVEDLIECGVSVHDPQLRANTLDGIARAYKGKLCAQVDLDRQSFPFLGPRDIVSRLGMWWTFWAIPWGDSWSWRASRLPTSRWRTSRRSARRWRTSASHSLTVESEPYEGHSSRQAPGWALPSSGGTHLTGWGSPGWPPLGI